MPTAVISHRRYLDGISRLSRIVRTYVTSVEETDIWKVRLERATADLEEVLGDHLDSGCAECIRDYRDRYDQMPSAEADFLAACVGLVQRHRPRTRTAVSLHEYRTEPFFNVAASILKKYGDEDAPTEELSAVLMNGVLDTLWIHIRAFIPNDMSPMSRRTR
jgi:hypothetical protein